MGSIFGHLNLNDSDRVYAQTAGQVVIYKAVLAYVARVNAELAAATSLFVMATTDKFTERFRLPGTGTLQRRGSNGRFGSVKTIGSWDVAYPIEDFGAQLSGNDVDMRYMTVGDLDMHAQTVVTQNVNTVRFETLKAIFNKANRTFSDPLHGDLTIRALANTDGTLYPPITGSETPAQAGHYVGLNYTAISDTNNPFKTLRDSIEDEFGASTGGPRCFAMINRAQRAETEALKTFVPVTNRFTSPGTNTATVINIPNLPGEVIGTADGVWVTVWPHIPSGYIYGQHLDSPAPLKRRIDPADTGLGDGLQLVAQEIEFPFESTSWRHRFGYGVGNRLNGYCYQLVGSTTYTTPTIFA